jgi:phenylacetate-CoA ligase
MSPKEKDFMPKEELRALQLKRLQETVERVYHLVPSYRKNLTKPA